MDKLYYSSYKIWIIQNTVYRITQNASCVSSNYIMTTYRTHFQCMTFYNSGRLLYVYGHLRHEYVVASISNVPSLNWLDIAPLCRSLKPRYIHGVFDLLKNMSYKMLRKHISFHFFSFRIRIKNNLLWILMYIIKKKSYIFFK